MQNAGADDDLREAIPAILEQTHKFLCETEVVYVKELPLQRLRHQHLEIIQKIRNAEYFRPHAATILSLLFKLVEVKR